MKVGFFTSNSMDAPLHVVVPELFVPVMEGFRSEELAGFSSGTIWKSPVSPEGCQATLPELPMRMQDSLSPTSPTSYCR